MRADKLGRNIYVCVYVHTYVYIYIHLCIYTLYIRSINAEHEDRGRHFIYVNTYVCTNVHTSMYICALSTLSMRGR